MKSHRHGLMAFSIVTILALVLAACGATPTATPPAPTATATTAAKPTAAPTSAAAGSGTPVATAAAAAPTVAATAAAPTTAPTVAPTVAPTAGAATAVKNPTTFVESQISDISSMDPHWQYDTASQEIAYLVYETLVFPKKDSVTDFVPMLATKWDMSSDGRTYTFTIRQGVKFQNGDTMTAQDVAYSLWRSMTQDRAGGPSWILLQPFFGLEVQSFQDDVVTKQYGGDFAAAVTALQKMIAFDNTAGTVTISLKSPYGPMLQILSQPWAAVLDMKWVASKGGWDGTAATAQKFHDPKADADELFKIANGTGPYMLDRWAPGEEIDLNVNPNYWVKDPLWTGGPVGPAKLQRIAVKIVSEWGTRFAATKTGDADSLYVPRQYITQIDALVKETCDYKTGQCTTVNPQGTLRLFKGLPTVGATTIFLNQMVNVTGGNATVGSGKLDGNGITPDFFADLHVRKAFNYAFDWNTYIQQVYNGEAEQAFGPIIDGELGYSASQPHYSFNLDQATAEFKASTLKSASGQSLWDIGFYAQYIFNSGNDQRRAAGEILKASLAKINPKFKLAVVEEPFPVELKDQTDGRLALFMLGWQEDFHDPIDWIAPYLASGGTYGGTQHFAKDLQAQIDLLASQAASATDAAACGKMYGQLQDLAYQNALDIFVVQPQDRHYEQLWVKGWFFNPTFGNYAQGGYFYSESKSP